MAISASNTALKEGSIVTFKRIKAFITEFRIICAITVGEIFSIYAHLAVKTIFKLYTFKTVVTIFTPIGVVSIVTVFNA